LIDRIRDKMGFSKFGDLSAESKAGLKGVGWTTLAQIAGMVFRFASLLIVPRLLSPDDYGIFFPALAIVLVVELLADVGIRPALIRHPLGDSTPFVSTAWTILLFRGFALCLFVLLVGSIIPPYYKSYDPKLLFQVIAALSIKPVLHSFANPMAMLLHRQMRYDLWNLLEFSQTVIGVIVTIIAAYLLRNVWAVVIGTLVGELVFVAMSYIICKRPPMPSWYRNAARELAQISNQVFLNTLVMALWLYVDRLLGPVFGDPELMGLYGVAFNLMEVIERLIGKLCDVYYATLTKIAKQSQADYHANISKKIALFFMPALALGVILGPWVIQLLYKTEYNDAGIPFSILLARLMFRVLGQFHFQLLLVRGKIRPATLCYLVAFIIQMTAIIPLARFYGIQGIAYSVLISTFANTLMQNLVFVRQKELGFVSLNITLAYAIFGLSACWLLHKP
jgi:O-antigen/teichoic acid export membrane protein